jgi:peptidoglycan/LPS O-acetylase OafA/YrhL
MNTPQRHHALDAVRASALLAGILLHSTLSFWPGFRELRWPISDDSTSLALSGLFFVLHVFRMSLFFVIAGFFAHALLERLGPWGFVKNRLRRIALPLVVAMLVVGPLLILPFVWGQKQLGFSGPPAIRPPIPDPHMPPWGHLWFLYLLLVLYALWLAARAVIGFADRNGALTRGAEGLLGGLVSVRIAPLVLAGPAAAAMFQAPWWSMWQGIPPPIMGFIPNFPALLAFGTAFGFGWFLHRRPGWLDVMKRDWALHLSVAVLLTCAALWLIGAYPRVDIPVLPPLERALYAASYNAAGWFWIFGLIGAAVRFLERPSPRWRYLADASFFVYLVHLPVVYALQAWMMRWPVHWSVKYPLIVALTTTIVFPLYHYGVRSTFVGQFLNGRRYPREAALTSAPSTSPG